MLARLLKHMFSQAEKLQPPPALPSCAPPHISDPADEEEAPDFFSPSKAAPQHEAEHLSAYITIHIPGLSSSEMEAVAPLIRQLGALHAKQPSSIAEMSLKNELGDPAGLILQYLDTPETIAAIDMLQTTTADGGVPFAIVVTDKVAALLGLPPNHKRDFDAFITRTTLSDTAVGTSIPLGSDVRRFQLLRFGTVGGLQYMNPAHMALVLKAIRTVAASKHSTAARLDSRIQVSVHYDLIYAPDNLGSNTKSAIGICTYLFVEADLLDVEGRDPPFATFIKRYAHASTLPSTERGLIAFDRHLTPTHPCSQFLRAGPDRCDARRERQVLVRPQEADHPQAGSGRYRARAQRAPPPHALRGVLPRMRHTAPEQPPPRVPPRQDGGGRPSPSVQRPRRHGPQRPRCAGDDALGVAQEDPGPPA